MPLSQSSNFGKVYPNPASEILFVETEFDSYLNANLNIIDLQGNIVLNQAIVQPKTVVDVNRLAPGNYIYVIKKDAISTLIGQFSVIR